MQLLGFIRRHRWLALAITAGIAVAVSLAARWHAITTHHERTLARYRESLSVLQDAQLNQSARWAPNAFAQARSQLNAAQAELDSQNQRWLLMRDYSVADSLLASASGRVRETMKLAREAARSERDTVTKRHRELARRIEVRQKDLDTSLFRLDTYRLLTHASTQLDVAANLMDEGHTSEALATLDSCEESLEALERRLDRHRSEESSRQAEWDEWVSQTLATSKATGTRAIVVDKSAHRLLLVSRGKISKTFSCDLGFNPAVQKIQSGDGATPEGMYRVTRVRPTGSKYYKALMLNYPNDRDRMRFSANRESGLINNSARIGGLIEIHGDGGQGRDWTDGCVALSNEDMDTLMKYVEVGTPVTIVRRSGLVP